MIPPGNVPDGRGQLRVVDAESCIEWRRIGAGLWAFGTAREGGVTELGCSGVWWWYADTPESRIYGRAMSACDARRDCERAMRELKLREVLR